MSDALIAAPCVVYLIVRPGDKPAAVGVLEHSTYTYFTLQDAVFASIQKKAAFSMYKTDPQLLFSGHFYVLPAPEEDTLPYPDATCRMTPSSTRPEVVNGTKCILLDISRGMPAAGPTSGAGSAANAGIDDAHVLAKLETVHLEPAVFRQKLLTVSTVKRADEAALSSMGNAPLEFTLFFRRAGFETLVPLTVRADLRVGFLLEDIKKKMLGLREVEDGLITLLLEATAVGSAAGSGDAVGDAAVTNFVPLNSMATISDALMAALGREATVHDKLSIFVDVAGIPRPGSVPFDATLGIVKELWKDMSDEVQNRALLVVKERRKLAAVPMLRDMRGKMTVKQAERNLVNVLDVSGDEVTLGVFDVLAVDSSFVVGPKGFIDLKDTTHFFIPDRASLVEEFLRAMDTKQRGSGVLLSGPNGVGKSAVGLLAYLCCLAQGRFAVYIPNSREWLAAAETGLGDEFLVERFFLLNLDLIAANTSLRKVFAKRFRGVPIGIDVVATFRYFLTFLHGPAVAVIADEFQCTTNAIEVSRTQPSPTRMKAADYFLEGWASWDIRNSCFVRMDIASSHGMREFMLPDGERKRLRFVRPWPLKIVDTALASTFSPAFVNQPTAHSRIVRICGGVIRKLMRCREILPTGAISAKDLSRLEIMMRKEMSIDCGNWLKKHAGHESQRRELAASLFSLIRGKVEWSLAKGAYDEGLVHLLKGDVFVAPVSPVAASVLYSALALEFISNALPRPLSSISTESERGYELERRVLARFHRCDLDVETKLLSGEKGMPIHVRTHSMMPFDILMDTAALSSQGILYVPNDGNFNCDAIVVPASLSDEMAHSSDIDEAHAGHVSSMSTLTKAVASRFDIAPLQVWECSMTDPRDSGRVKKCSGWFDAGDFIAKLRSAHPMRQVIVVLCWPGTLERSGHEKYKGLNDQAAKVGVQICVVDGESLLRMGVLL